MMKKCSRISLRDIERTRLRKTRPTIKVFFYNNKGEVLVIHKDGKVSFPGGGVDEGENLPKALVRECVEELVGILFSYRTMREAKILSVGLLETTKPAWKNKKVFLVMVYCRSLEAIKPSDHEHYDFLVLKVADAIAYVRCHEATQEKARRFYVRAFLKLAKLKKWKE